MSYEGYQEQQPCIEGIVLLTDEISDVVEQLKRVKDFKKQIEKREEELKNQLNTLMCDGTSVVSKDGEEIVSWQFTKDSKYFDAKRFEAEQPELYGEYVAMRPGVKRLVLR